MKIENRNVIIYIYGIVKLYYKESYMHKLIILRGNSGSGKTTVSKELQKKFDKKYYVHISGYGKKTNSYGR